MKIPVSVYLIVFNCAHEVGNALESVREWADEVICVDSFSTDDTVAVCESFGATVYKRAWEGYSPQLRYAEGLCRNDWALRIDADETVSPELEAELKEMFAGGKSPDDAVSGYKIRRRNYVQKRWISGGGFYPSWHLRFFRRSRGGHIERKIHEKVKVSGKVLKLRGCLDHWCWQEDFEMWENFFNYARIEAEHMTEQGRRVHFWNLTYLPAGNFLRRYFLRGAWKQGTFGAVTSMRHACEHAVRLMMAWEIQNRSWLNEPDPTYLAAKRRKVGEDG
jgi:glycosyltransferase involved in cell wall biosynthesis